LEGNHICGLVGFFSQYVADPDREKMAFLLMQSTTRGRDSTGIASLIRKGTYNQPKEIGYHYFKSPVNAHKFMEMPEFRSLMRFDNTKGWMGHTRAATIGAVNAENSHPFVSTGGNIVGCHNGSLRGEYPFKVDGRTDSESIMNLLEAEGEVGLNKVTGAWALTYFNLEDETFNIIRNDERPLSYVVTGAGDFAYASEPWMLGALLGKYNMTGDIVNLEPYQKLTLDLTKEQFIKTLDVAPVEGLEAPKVTTTYGGGFFRSRGWESAYDFEEPAVHNRQWDFETGTWRTEPAVERQQQQASRPAITSNLPVATTTPPAGTRLIADAVKSRAQGAAAAQTSRETDQKVIGLDSRRKSATSSGSSEPSDKATSEDAKREKRFLNGLPERQRISAAGEIEVETIAGAWMAIDDFLDLIDLAQCKWTDEVTSITDKRVWLNAKEFVLAEVWERDHELRHILGVNSHTGLPEAHAFSRLQ
jgi:Glutamine amidotransferase domain